MIRLIALVLFVLFFNLIASAAELAPEIVVTPKDSVILQEKLDKFSKDRDLAVGTLMVKIGCGFVGTPYVAKTLDVGINENLVVNLHELDCTTFVEN